MTKLTFTKDDPPPPESLPDAPRARAASAATAAPPEAPGEDAAVDTEWTEEDAAFMAGWEQSDESDVSDGEPCPFCGGLGHSVDDCPMRRDTKGEVAKEQRPDPVARLVDVVADAVLDVADENLSAFLARLAANGLRAQRYNDLVSELVPGICADAAFDPEMLASKFEVDPEGLLLLRETVRREVDKLRATHALHKDDLTGNLSPEQLSSFSSAKTWDDDDTREMPVEPPPPPPPPPPRTVDLPALGIRVSADPTDDDDDNDDRDEVFARSPSGRVDWRAPGQPVDGASSVRLAPVREEGDDSGDEDDLPAEYLERLSKDLGRLVVQEGRSLDSF
ncbi:unnamed protein product [Pelagomonas calceolata]|uniref:CCHC-type domain-containing protein n=1 Tax=Pelagomonas calceolata TaxID=35677 RepID=A0A8J2WQB2_9STRA|nr:unnamed protein product [Pelagomonas calceolata]|mmetsp:Transcript_19329/g.59702  ORF Transcript_19329/g.59702 Transcript_19329/m.59702 type:complete len:335 (-) Transcript_19329:14-1018(-)